MTSKEYMSCVTAIEPSWLVEVAPNFFSFKKIVSDNPLHQAIDKKENKIEEKKEEDLDNDDEETEKNENIIPLKEDDDNNNYSKHIPSSVREKNDKINPTKKKRRFHII